jgi:hypothetical protein
MYLQKGLSKKTLKKTFSDVFDGILSATDEKTGSGSPVSQWYGTADPDPDPYQNVTDPQHWLVPRL